MYTSIVVGTDGSQQALDAIRRAGQLAGTLDLTQVHVVAAIRPYSPTEIRQLRHDLPAEFHDLLVEPIDSADRFSEARAVLRPMKIDVVEHERTGNPADAILGVAEQVHADLVVVGARGLGAVRRFVRGSVSTRVAHHSPCDVLIVEHDHDADR